MLFSLSISSAILVFGVWQEDRSCPSNYSIYSSRRVQFSHACKRHHIFGQLLLRDLLLFCLSWSPPMCQYSLVATAAHQNNTNPYSALAKLSIASTRVSCRGRLPVLLLLNIAVCFRVHTTRLLRIHKVERIRHVVRPRPQLAAVFRRCRE